MFFKDVTVVVPRSWRDSRCQTKITTPRGALVYRSIDVHIGSDHPLHRQSPFTQQSRGCGLAGDFISMPYQFFTNWNQTEAVYGNPARIFVHEWAKFRYGIFDEFGYAGDKIYPNFYKVNDQILPTGSSDVALKGAWYKNENNDLCDPSLEANCHFVPDLNANGQITCSLGYLPFLPNVNRYCKLNEQFAVHQSLPPTKHNVLCAARGAAEVIAMHPDLINRGSPVQPPFSNITINVVKEPVTKYVLLLESSSTMIKQDLWKWISKAAQKFIRNDLPLNTKLAIVTFSNDSIIQHNLAPLTDEAARARIADSIPDKYKVQRSPDQRCVRCGVEAVIQQVLAGDEAGAHIILVTRGDNGLNISDEAAITAMASSFQIRFSSVLVPRGGKSPSHYYDSISAMTQGRSFVFQLPTDQRNNVGAGVYYQMIEAFYALRRLDSPDDVPVSVHSNVVTREAPNLKSSGAFSIDSTLGQATLFGIIVDEPDDHNIKSVKFIDNSGQMYGPYTSLSNEFIVINMKTINFPKDTPAPPFDDVILIYKFSQIRPFHIFYFFTACSFGPGVEI